MFLRCYPFEGRTYNEGGEVYGGWKFQAVHNRREGGKVRQTTRYLGTLAHHGDIPEDKVAAFLSRFKAKLEESGIDADTQEKLKSELGEHLPGIWDFEVT